MVELSNIVYKRHVYVTKMSKDNNSRYLIARPLITQDEDIIEIEKYCAFFSFENSIIAFQQADDSRWSNITRYVSGDSFIAQIKAFSSSVIQSRIELDALCAIDLLTLKPTGILKLSKLKRDLILIINKQK